MSRSVSWAAFIERRYRAILAVSLLITLLSASSLAALRFDFDVLGMLPTGAPAFDNFKTLVADFGELDELIILVEGTEVGTLHAFADALAARLRGLDTVVSVQAKVEVEQVDAGILGPFVYNYVPAEGYTQLGQRLTPAGLDAIVAANRTVLRAPFDFSAARWLRRDPLGFTPLAARVLAAAFDDTTLNVTGGYMGTKDGRALLILVRPTHNAFDTAFTTHFMRQVRDAATAARSATAGADALRVGYTGSYAFALEDAATLKWDVGRYTLLALVGVLAIFYMGYRNLRILPFVTYPLVLSTVITFAASLACYAQLNAVSISFAAILYGLSIDSGIQYYTRLLQELERHDLRGAVARTLSGLGRANVVASATTAAAFFVIGFSQLAGVSQLGFLTAIGMLVTIVEFLVIYPALSFLVPRASLTHGHLDVPRLGHLAEWTASHRRGVSLAVGLAGVALVPAALHVGFDTDLTRLRPAHTEASRVQDEIAARFASSAAAAAVLVRAATTEEALQQSERVAARLAAYRGEGLVHSTRSVTALLPSERTQRERLALFNRLPREAVVRDLRLALDKQGFVSTQFEAFFAEFTRPHEAVVRFGDAVLDPFAGVLGRFIRQRADGVTVATYFEPVAKAGLADVADRLRRDLPGTSFIIASRTLLQEDLGRLLRRELVGFCTAAFLLNLILVLWNFPRFGLACAILIPEVLVIIGFLALLQLTGVGIDPVTLIVVPLILGIGVDNCVYVAERYQQGEPPGGAVRHGGRALVISALTTMAGFGFLGLSHYPALARMGLFTAVSLFLCFAASVSVLPALLAVLASRPGPSEHGPDRGLNRGLNG
jgi:predicted RND superfamily exporter protein